MKLRLSDWVGLAEIVSSLAVVLTLIMLILNVRENTEIVRAGSYDALLGNVNETALTIVQNEQLLHVWQLHVSGQLTAMTEEESLALLILLRTAYRDTERAHFAHKYGTIGSAEYERFDRQACRDFDRIDSGTWEDIKQVLTTEFAKHVESLCARDRSSEAP